MKILALDMSTSHCSIALCHDDKTLYAQKLAPMQQARFVLGMIEDLLQSFSFTLADLNAIAYGCGPGSFTGVRIANTIAQGLGFGLNCPLIPISSLAAIAEACFLQENQNKVFVAMDARIEQIYWGSYQVSQQTHMELLNTEALINIADLNSINFTRFSLPDWVGVGTAWSIYNDKLFNQLKYNLKIIDLNNLNLAQGILSLAKTKFYSQTWITPAAAQPVYLR
jgi:tRNA threonylcarbamoyladenosine biosynthesis protein TsaB